MTDEQWKSYEEAMEKISKSKIYFDDSFGITIPELRSKIRRLMENDISLIIIDQLEQIRGYEGQPAYIQLDKIAYDIKDFTKGIKTLLSKNGVVTIEFPHFMELLLRLQFDTIYHEHFSYLSLHVVKKIFESCGLKIFDVEKISTHGGSLRIYGCHSQSEKPVLDSVQKVLRSEVSNGLLELDSYLSFKNKVQDPKGYEEVVKELGGRKSEKFISAAKHLDKINDLVQKGE